MRRARISTLAAVALGILLLALSPPLVGWLAVQPYLGLRLAPAAGGLRVVHADARSTAAAAGVRRGDVLRSIGGVRPRPGLDAAADRAFRLEVINRYRAGDAAEWVVERDGEARTVQATFVPHRPSRLLTHLLAHLVFWVVAFGLLALRWNDGVVRLLALAVLANTAAWFYEPAADLPLNTGWGFVLQQVCAIGRFLAPALAVHFGLAFPTTTVSARSRRWILGLAYGVTGALFLVEEAVLIGGALDPALPYLVYPGVLAAARYPQIRFWVYIMAYVAAAGLMLQTYVRVSDRKRRDQVKWVMWSVVFAAGLEALLVMVAPAFGAGFTEGVVQPFVDLGYLLIAAALVVAILRHDLFDIDRVIRKTVLYFATTALLFLLFTGAESFLSVVFEAVFAEQAGFLGAVFSGIIAAVLFLPVRHWIDRALGAVLPPEPRGTNVQLKGGRG